MAFKKFNKYNTKNGVTLYAGRSKTERTNRYRVINGRFGANVAKAYDLKRGQRVEFYFDKESKMIGMKKTDDPVAYALCGKKTQNDVRFGLASFVNHYNIKVTEKKTYPITQHSSGMLIWGPVELNEKGAADE